MTVEIKSLLLVEDEINNEQQAFIPSKVCDERILKYWNSILFLAWHHGLHPIFVIANFQPLKDNQLENHQVEPPACLEMADLIENFSTDVMSEFI